jgi:hypothetical protein
VKETVPFDEPIGSLAKNGVRTIFVKVAIPDNAVARSVPEVEQDRIESNVRWQLLVENQRRFIVFVVRRCCLQLSRKARRREIPIPDFNRIARRKGTSPRYDLFGNEGVIVQPANSCLDIVVNVDAIVARIAEIAILQFDKALGL